jgi:ribonucleoside-diphosphate reductase alpha chain
MKFELTENAIKLLEQRYLKKDDNFKVVETPDEMFHRVAKFIANVEKPENKERYEKHFYKMLSNLEFMPNTPTLSNANSNKLNCLSACFVLDIEDTIEDIFNTLKNTALIFKQGGGVGINFSKLRPEGDILSSTKGTSTGAISFMKLFDDMVNVVKQGGIRRGAMMSVLSVYHPEIEEFIKMKRHNGTAKDKVFTNMNISVLVDNNFIYAVKQDKDIELVNPHTKKIVKKVNARSIFNEIIKSAWMSGDPGLLFFERLNDGNNIYVDTINCVNPCGEQPLVANESCNLGSINLESFIIKNNYEFEEFSFNRDNFVEVFKNYIDFERLIKVIKYSVRFLDNVIDAGEFILPEIKAQTLRNRKIGLGLMGFANMLYRLGIPYDDTNGRVFAECLMDFVKKYAFNTSEELGNEKGVFPNYDLSVFKLIIKRRNANILTLPPTGSISQIVGTSSGIEPNYELAYRRNGFEYINKPFYDYLMYLYNDKEVVNDFLNQYIYNSKIAMNKLSSKSIKVFKIANEIEPIYHIRMQETFQKYVDSAISKTINLPNSATEMDIKEIYNYALDSTIKGITVFRDGCLQDQVIVKINNTCSECGGNMKFDGKCYRCDKCGHSDFCSL